MAAHDNLLTVSKKGSRDAFVPAIKFKETKIQRGTQCPFSHPFIGHVLIHPYVSLVLYDLKIEVSVMCYNRR